MLDNTVYNNTYGVVDDGTNTIIDNNTLYGNATGIQIGLYSSSTNHSVINNTIVQASGVALNLLSGNATGTTFLDNIVSLQNAVGIVAPEAAQSGFVSDYNLYYLQTGATLATWSGQSLSTLNDFKTEAGQDFNSISADPLFVDAAGNNYALQNSSPALNRGDLALQYLAEPVGVGTGNGDRMDIGAQGGTAEANPSPAQLVQLLGSTGGQRYQVGQAATISFRSAGLSALDPVVFINAAGGAVAGSESWNVWQANEFNTGGASPVPASVTVNANGLDVPQAVLQNMLLFNFNGTPTTKYSIPVAAGTYQVTLLFVDTQSTAAGQREFNILANGVAEATNYDVFKAAGGANTATEVTFDVTTSGGTGIGARAAGRRRLADPYRDSNITCQPSANDMDRERSGLL